MAAATMGIPKVVSRQPAPTVEAWRSLRMHTLLLSRSTLALVGTVILSQMKRTGPPAMSQAVFVLLPMRRSIPILFVGIARRCHAHQDPQCPAARSDELSRFLSFLSCRAVSYTRLQQ